MALATLTKMGRAAIAKAILDRSLYLAWGSGLEEWEGEGVALPSLVDATSLYTEVGRRIVTTKGFVEPDSQGGIVVPVGTNPDGTVEEARYSQVTGPTPYIYVRVNFDFADAASSIIREMGIFMDTVTDTSLPVGQLYFTPDQITESGMLLAAQIITPSINRSPAVRQSVEFVLPI